MAFASVRIAETKPRMGQDYRWRESPLKTRGLGWTVVCLLVKILLTHSICSETTTSPHHLDITYSELEDMYADCYPLDSCWESRTNDSIIDFNCHCGRFCVDFDTCCIDSEFRDSRPVTKTPHSCVQIYWLSTNVFMIDRCAPDWSSDDYARAMCDGNPKTLNDPLLLVPFTSSETGFNYRNSYCADCNHESGNRGTYWNVRLTGYSQDVNSSSVDGIPTIAYDPKTWSWRLPDFPGSPSVDVRVETPEGVAPYVKACRDDVISTCAADWADDVTRWKCSSYMAIITAKSTGKKLYRNVHCAICNHEVNFEALCQDLPSGGSVFGGGGRGPSFAMLLDVNRSDGDRVGEVQRCKSNEKYDPFAKRCRGLRCGIPGYVIRNGSCVRQ